MATSKYYRVAVNKESEIYSHFEPCGEDLAYATNEFNKACKETEDDDTVELQEDNYTGNWITIDSK